MPKYRIKVSQVVYYDVEVNAPTFNEAIDLVQDQIDEGEELDCYEVDSSDFEIESERSDPEEAEVHDPTDPLDRMYEDEIIK